MPVMSRGAASIPSNRAGWRSQRSATGTIVSGDPSASRRPHRMRSARHGPSQLEFSEHRFRHDPPHAFAQRQQARRIIGEQQPQAQCLQRVQPCDDTGRRDVPGEVSSGREQLRPRGRRLGGEVEVTDPAQDLHPHEAQEERVPKLAGRRVREDHIRHLAGVRVVAVPICRGTACVLAVGASKVPVAHVVREDGDHLRPEVGLHDEQLVLQPSPTLREPQVVLAQERRPEHLVGRQAVDEGGVLDRAGLDVRAEQAEGNEAEVARLLADHDVGAVAIGHRHLARERFWCEGVVLIEKLHVLPARDVDADVAGPARPTRVGRVDDADVGMLGRECVQARRRCVRGSVVHEDGLPFVRLHGLSQQRGNAQVHGRARVVDGDDHGDLHASVSVQLRPGSVMWEPTGSSPSDKRWWFPTARPEMREWIGSREERIAGAPDDLGISAQPNLDPRGGVHTDGRHAREHEAGAVADADLQVGAGLKSSVHGRQELVSGHWRMLRGPSGDRQGTNRSTNRSLACPSQAPRLCAMNASHAASSTLAERIASAAPSVSRTCDPTIPVR